MCEGPRKLRMRLSLGAITLRGQTNEDVPERRQMRSNIFPELIYVFNVFSVITLLQSKYGLQ